jgi:hypothetical protein
MKTDNKRKLVELDEYFMHDFRDVIQGTIDDVILNLKKIEKEIKSEISKRKLKYDKIQITDCDEYNITFSLCRYETDEEMKVRKRLEKALKEHTKMVEIKKVEEEKKLYEELKKKYGNNND